MTSCGLQPQTGDCLASGARCECSDARRLDDGSCCPAWSYASAGSCAFRGWRLAVDPVDENAVDPRVAVVAGDDVVLTYLQVETNLSTQVMIGQWDGRDWRLRAPGVRLTGDDYVPQVSAAADGAAVVAWRQDGDARSLIHRSIRSSHGLWLDPAADEEAASFPPGAHEPDVLVADDGEGLLVWSQSNDAGIGVAVERFHHPNLFEGPQDANDVLSPAIKFCNDPKVARNAAGDALVSWYQSVGGALMAFVSERSGIDGGFSRPGPSDHISPVGAPVDTPVPALSITREGVVAWQQQVDPAGMAVFVAHRSADGLWDQPATLADSFSIVGDFAADARPVYTPSGDLYVIWRQDHGDDIAVYVAHRLSDHSWTAAGTDPLRLSSPGVRGYDPWIAVGRDGGVVAVWTEYDGERQRVIARRTAADAAGSTEAERWGAREVLSRDAFGDAGGAHVSVGGDADATVVVWDQNGAVWAAAVDEPRP